MAAKKLVPSKMEFDTGVAKPVATTVGAEGMDLDFSGKDDRILIEVGNATATFLPGNSSQGGGEPLIVEAGKCVVLNSGRFKNVTGDSKGCVHITGATATIIAVELP